MMEYTHLHLCMYRCSLELCRMLSKKNLMSCMHTCTIQYDLIHNLITFGFDQVIMIDVRMEFLHRINGIKKMSHTNNNKIKKLKNE